MRASRGGRDPRTEGVTGGRGDGAEEVEEEKEEEVVVVEETVSLCLIPFTTKSVMNCL